MKHQNSFTFIRLVLALIIVYHHYLHFVNNGGFWGTEAVSAFFVISGYFVTQSWQRSNSLKDYAMKRICRLYPALIVALLIGAFVVYPIIYWCEYGYFGIQQLAGAIAYLHNLTLRQITYSIDSFPKDGLNGSLWTLEYEMKGYIIIALFGQLGWLRSRKYVYLLTAIALYSYFLYPLSLPFHFLAYFTVGMSLAMTKIPKTKLVYGILPLMLIPLHHSVYSMVMFMVIPFSLVVLDLGYSLPIFRGLKNDYSYGLYVYHFPILNLLKYTGIELAWVFPLTFFMAWISWHYVESKFLKNCSRSPIESIIKNS